MIRPVLMTGLLTFSTKNANVKEYTNKNKYMEKFPNPDNPSERDSKKEAILGVFHSRQKKPSYFRHIPGWRDSIKRRNPSIADKDIDDLVNQDNNYTNRKDTYIATANEKDPVGREMREYEQVLESLIHYSAVGGTLFRQTKIGELGSDFDDKANGVDVLIGLNNKEGETTVFSLDACAAGQESTVLAKFEKSDSPEYAPNCSEIRYCYFNEYDDKGNRQERFLSLPYAPHYIVGANKATICHELDDQIKVEGTDPKYSQITGICSEDFRKKILVEIYIQSRTGFNCAQSFRISPPEYATKGMLACAKKVREQHRTVAEAARSNLYTLFGINRDDPEAKDELDKAIEQFAYCNTDDVAFSTIYKKAVADYGQTKAELDKNRELKNKAMGEKANDIADKTKPDDKDS